MKWATLLQNLKEKVGFPQPPSVVSSPSSSDSTTFHESYASSDEEFIFSPSRGKHELELGFKRYWQEFHSSNLEKEKEKALNMTIDAFCKLAKQQADVAQLITMSAEPHIFSFVVGRAFVTDIEKLKLSSKTRSLEVERVLNFFSEITEDGINPGANLLYAVEILVSGPTDEQSLLDSGVLCCLLHILNSLLDLNEGHLKQYFDSAEELLMAERNVHGDNESDPWLEVEGSIVHVMKALSSHPSAAHSLIEDNSLQLLFQMVANGSFIAFSQYKDGLVSLHTLQLYRHAMQILGLLLANDNGSTAKYIHKHFLMKVLLQAVKDFTPDCGDSAYTMGIVDMLLECVELTYRPRADGVRLREDIHNAHGYQFLVQFALALSKSESGQSSYPKSLTNQEHGANNVEGKHLVTNGAEGSPKNVSPTLSRLLDVLVSLAQTGPALKTSKMYHANPSGHGRSYSSSSDQIGVETYEDSNGQIKDLEAVQVLQDIFMKADCRELQVEVLNRMFKIFSSHVENYKMCQQLRTISLFILNMDDFPPSLQEIILKILEYAVTVVNCIPEQELLALCCLLQQPITFELKHIILSFFIKLLSFDQKYNKVLREVGILEVLLDDLKKHKFISGIEHQNGECNELETKSSLDSFMKHMDSKDLILSSPKLLESGSQKLIFEVESTIAVAWDCMASLLKKAEASQASFRSANGVITILPFLVSNIHRPGVLRVISCLIIEDVSQSHPEELGAVVDILKSGMVTTALGSQYRIQYDAKCDIFGALWRILGVNKSAQRVFGEATGFSLLFTTLQTFLSYELGNQSLTIYVKVFTYLLRVMTTAVCDNAANRTKLQTIISSHTFYDLLLETGIICVDCERQVVHLLLELALEIVIPPSLVSEGATLPCLTENESTCFLLVTHSGSLTPDKEWVYNAGAVKALLHALLLFTPKLQLEVLSFIDKLACASSFNKENLTSIGCVEVLLEMIYPFLSGLSPLLSLALKIIEVLGAYRLSASELRVIIRCILQMRLTTSGRFLVDMMEKLILKEDMASEDVALAPFIEIDMSKTGHASIHVPLGERSWPPAAGYSFVCWFQFQNLFKSQSKEPEALSVGQHHHEPYVLQMFSVGATDSSTAFYAELHIREDGVLTLATSSTFSLSFSGLEMEEGKWHHLAFVHSKPNVLAGLFQSSVAYVYLDGKLRHTGRLGCSPSPPGKALQVVIGKPVSCARVSDFSWKLRSCYLFEEVLSPGSICFMYILGRGYRGLFQDSNLLQFVPDQACGGGSMAILDSLDVVDLPLTSLAQKPKNAGKQGSLNAECSGFVWDFEQLGNLSLELSGKKLIFAFEGTSTELTRVSATVSVVNLVDPMSAAASPIGGIPRIGRLVGDVYICKQCVIGETIRPIGGIAVVLCLVEAAETMGMLHMALTMLACALHQNPQNVSEMQQLRGYHLLALFLHRRMSLFDMQSLEIFFKIAACEASFSVLKKFDTTEKSLPPTVSTISEVNIGDLSLSKSHDDFSSVDSNGDMDDFSPAKDSFSPISELENTDMPTETSNCVVLSNADMVEHVLLDWTVWVTAPIPIQIALLGFLEHLVSMHWYRNHNLTILRRINLVQHLLVTLYRGDVEVPVLEKLVVLLGLTLENGFLPSELESVVGFVIMTFDPPKLTLHHQINRESMGKHVIVRNMLLEMFIDLQVTIKSEGLLEQWHKIVSSKLITYFLDEAVHPTSMRWVMTFLGVCLASSSPPPLPSSSPVLPLDQLSGGYHDLARVLRSFYDTPDIYYILFCLIFGKPVYPRLPEVRMLDFHALMPSDEIYGELKFTELLESVFTMAKSTFDRLYMQSMLAHQTGNLSQISAGIVSELADESADLSEELQGEALAHKTYAARLMGGEASAPASAVSVLRFMVDLAKMSPPFAMVCRRAEFLESCIALYFSCVRAAHAVKIAKQLSVAIEEKNRNDGDEANRSRNTCSSLPHDQKQSVKAAVSLASFPRGHARRYSEDIPVGPNNVSEDKRESQKDLSKEMKNDAQPSLTIDGEVVDQVFMATPSSNGSSFHDKSTPDLMHLPNVQSSPSSTTFESPTLCERSNTRIPLLGSAIQNDTKCQIASSPYTESAASSFNEIGSSSSSDTKSSYQGQNTANAIPFAISSKLLLEVDDAGYGGGPCSAGATAVLDFMAEVVSGLVTEQVKVVPFIEAILESVPLDVDSESVLVFHGLWLTAFMNFLERRLLRDDEENEKKLDRSCWSSNLEALSSMLVERVYVGAFPRPSSVLKALEFLLSMLQLANKDGRVEEAAPKGLLYIGRGSRQLDTYVAMILKNMNRMILFCFFPSFLTSIGEDELLSRLGLQIESNKRLPKNSTPEDGGVDICTVLQLLVANRRIIFCPSNIDTDLNCCLCINLISLLRDHRRNAKNMAADVLKYLLVHRRAAFKDLLVCKPNRGNTFDVLHGGSDKLLTGNLSAFFEWLHSSELEVNKVLEQSAAIAWVQYITGPKKFVTEKIKSMDSRRKKEMGRKLKDSAKLDDRYWEQIKEQRLSSQSVRDRVTTELRVISQDKYGCVLHAENEWQTHLQQLVHERGIFPICKSSTYEEPEWQLCPIEGPYRMHKKFERCKLKHDTIQNVLNGKFELGELELPKEKTEDELDTSVAEPDYFFNFLNDNPQQCYFTGQLYNSGSILKDLDDFRDATSSKSGWIDDHDNSSVNEASLSSASDFCKAGSASTRKTESVRGRSDLGSPMHSLLAKNEFKVPEEKPDKELNDNGEYLIRPYLEPLEKIKCKYNCERVVGLDKHDGIFIIGELSLYVIENFFIDESGCIFEKESENDLSVIDQALGVKKDFSCSMDSHSKSSSSSWAATAKAYVGGRVWAYYGGAWGKEKVGSSGNVPHLWRMWNLDSVHEILKRDYQLRPVAIEIFSMDGCNDLLVFHKKEREEVFKNLVAMNLPRNSMLDATISGSIKHGINEGSRFFKVIAKSFSKRWQNGEISNFQYLMHLNTLAGRGYSDLTQYPVFPWVLADYDSENLNLSDPKMFRRLDKPMGCQTAEGEDEFRKRFESWDDPEVPKFHYGSHYSSAGIVLFYLVRLPPFSIENKKLQGGQFDHADRLFYSIKDTWLSAARKGNTSDVKELVPEFFYMPEFLENRFNLDLGEKQSGEKVHDTVLPPWANGSAREFIRKHREALESVYVSENLHHWIDLIFGYKQRGKAAEKAVNVFYHYTYEGSVDIDSITDPAMKASILAQINHFGQTPKQLFLKPHVKRRVDRKLPPHLLKHSSHLVSREIRKSSSSSISQIVTYNDKVLVARANTFLKPRTFSKYVAWGFPDRSLRFMNYDQDRLLSTHENLHGGNQVQCVSASHDGQILVTGGDDGLVCIWRIRTYDPRASRNLQLQKALCAHTGKITCLHVSQPYMLIVSGSDDRTVILWDLSFMVFVKQLPEFPSPVSAIYVNHLTGEIVTAAGIMLAVWTINGDCLAVVNTSQLPSDSILSLAGCAFSDWLETNWYASGHQSGAIKVWKMVHCYSEENAQNRPSGSPTCGLSIRNNKVPEYKLLLHKVLKSHKHPVTALHLASDMKHFFSGDHGGNLHLWTLQEESLKSSAQC